MNIFRNQANCVIAHVLKCNCKFTLIFSTLWFCLFKNEIFIAPGLGSIRCNRIKWIKRESKCGRRIKLSSRSPFTHLLTFSTSVPREDAPANGRNVEGRLNCSPIHLSPFCHLLYLVKMQGRWLWIMVWMSHVLIWVLAQQLHRVGARSLWPVVWGRCSFANPRHTTMWKSTSTETQEVSCPSSLFIRLKTLMKTGTESRLKMAGK